jgi:hypothetical protein
MGFWTSVIASLMAAAALLFPAVPHQKIASVTPPPTTVIAAVALAPSSAPAPLSSLPTTHLFPLAGSSGQSNTARAPQAGVVLGTSKQAIYVTQNQLTAQIEQATNALRSLIYQNVSAPNSLPASGGYGLVSRLRGRIDQPRRNFVERGAERRIGVHRGPARGICRFQLGEIDHRQPPAVRSAIAPRSD